MPHAAAAEMASPPPTATLSRAGPQAIFSQRDSGAHSPGRAAYKWDFCLKGNEWHKKEKGRWMTEFAE